MVQDWLGYVTAPTTARYNLAPGSSIVAATPSQMADATARVVTSRGREIELAGAESGSGHQFRYSQTAVPGLYKMQFRDAESVVKEIPYYVARDPRESELKALSQSDQQGLLAAAGIQFAGNQLESATGGAEMVPRQEPVWGALLVALVALLAGELLLANRLSRLRHGFAVSVN
jgi:hypothetical protein